MQGCKDQTFRMENTETKGLLKRECDPKKRETNWHKWA